MIGFPPGEITGTMHIADDVAAGCQTDLALAISDANSRPPDVEMSGELGGMTLTPGVYKSSSGGFGLNDILTLDGENNPNAAWIFVATDYLNFGSNAQVVMINYDNSNGTNVWWSSNSLSVYNSGARLQGTVMVVDSISFSSGWNVANVMTGPLMTLNGHIDLAGSLVYPILPSTAHPVCTSRAPHCAAHARRELSWQATIRHRNVSRVR